MIAIYLYREQGQEFNLLFLFPALNEGKGKLLSIDCFLSNNENFKTSGKMAYMINRVSQAAFCSWQS